MRLDTSGDEARDRLEDAGAVFNETEDGWRARIGGGVVTVEEDGVFLRGNEERLRRILTDGGDGGKATVSFDGASRGNPGRSAVAYVVSDEDGVVKREGTVIGEATNNEAEYVALLRGLTEARELGYSVVEAVGDSELVVKQVGGEWRCRAKNLKPLHEEVLGVAEGFDDFEIRHVPRSENHEADELANTALDRRR
ncbi:MAG: ribonuclease HI family protein [Halobacteriales archaeon]|nr:ribonuclease HI family protein [Halobacteriales archaeon]